MLTKHPNGLFLITPEEPAVSEYSASSDADGSDGSSTDLGTDDEIENSKKKQDNKNNNNKNVGIGGITTLKKQEPNSIPTYVPGITFDEDEEDNEFSQQYAFTYGDD